MPRYIDADKLMDKLNAHYKDTVMSTCATIDECLARRSEICTCSHLVSEEPTIAVGTREINKDPTTDTKPTWHGHWIFHTFEEVMNGDWIVLSDWQGNGFECSNCGRLIAENEMAYKYKYCPNCGKKMDGKDDR